MLIAFHCIQVHLASGNLTIRFLERNEDPAGGEWNFDSYSTIKNMDLDARIFKIFFFSFPNSHWVDSFFKDESLWYSPFTMSAPLSTHLTSMHDLNRFPVEFYVCTKGHWSMQKITWINLFFFVSHKTFCEIFLHVIYMFSSVKLLNF